MPRSAHSFTTASSSSWRRSRSGGRAIDAPLLASGFEAGGLQIEVAPCHSTHEQPHQRAERPALIELLANLSASVGFRYDVVAGHGQTAGRALHPGPRGAGSQLGDLPHQLRHPRLLDLESLADREGGPVERDEPGDRCGPFRPALDVAEHLPDHGGGRIDRDAAISKHVPNGTSKVSPRTDAETGKSSAICTFLRLTRK